MSVARSLSLTRGATTQGLFMLLALQTPTCAINVRLRVVSGSLLHATRPIAPCTGHTLGVPAIPGIPGIQAIGAYPPASAGTAGSGTDTGPTAGTAAGPARGAAPQGPMGGEAPTGCCAAARCARSARFSVDRCCTRPAQPAVYEGWGLHLVHKTDAGVASQGAADYRTGRPALRT